MNADQRGLLHGELTDRILRVFFQVYNELGFGFAVSVCERSTAIALEQAGFKVQR
jgi:hypothetical protein